MSRASYPAYPFSNVVSIFWNTFLALVSSSGQTHETAGEFSAEMGQLPLHHSGKAPELRDLKADKFA